MIKKFDKKYLDYLLIQRTRLKTEYGITHDSDENDIVDALNIMTNRDFELIRSYVELDEMDNVNILDIGCGLACIDVFLDNYTFNSTYYLLDKTQSVDTGAKYNGFNKSYNFYNNMELLQHFAEDNFDNNKFKLVDAGTHEQLNVKFSLIMSLLSCGWHYSIGEYLNYIKETLTDDGTLIIDVRNDTEESLLYSNFHNVTRLYNPAEKRHDGNIIGYRYICKLKK
jgi:hypothetical protein